MRLMYTNCAQDTNLLSYYLWGWHMPICVAQHSVRLTSRPLHLFSLWKSYCLSWGFNKSLRFKHYLFTK